MSVMGAVAASRATKLVELGKFGQLRIYAKLENTEPSGSIKYRTVSRILEDAKASGKLRKYTHLIEISSGNTGIALAFRGRELGYPTTVITVKDATELAKKRILSYGAELVEVDGWFADAEKILKERMEREPDKWFWLQQTSNPSSLASNVDLGKEIARQFDAQFNDTIDLYVGSASTGSTLTGVGRALKGINPKTIVYRVNPVSEYRYAGVDDEGVSTVPLPLYDKSVVDKRLRIEESAAIEAARELASSHGHSVGVSAGADFAAAKSLAQIERGNCVIIFPDSGDRYDLGSS